MVDEWLITYTEETGKGGHHRVYIIALNEEEFKASSWACNLEAAQGVSEGDEESLSDRVNKVAGG